MTTDFLKKIQRLFKEFLTIFFKLPGHEKRRMYVVWIARPAEWSKCALHLGSGGVSRRPVGSGAKPQNILRFLASEAYKIPNFKVNFTTKICNIFHYTVQITKCLALFEES